MSRAILARIRTLTKNTRQTIQSRMEYKETKEDAFTITQSTFAGAMLSVLSDTGKTIRLLILIICSIIILWGSYILFVETIQYFRPPLSIEVKSSGAIIISALPSKRTAVFSLSSNGSDTGPWINTDIYVNKGQTLSFKASGRICLAVHRMMEAAIDDKLPPVPWSGPEGIVDGIGVPPRRTRVNLEALRKTNLITTNSYPGAVIGIISETQPPPWPKNGIIKIGKGKEIVAQDSGNLWLTINDVWLDENSEKIYTKYTNQGPEEFKKRIYDKKYWNLWYDDNSGSFLVTIEISK